MLQISLAANQKHQSWYLDSGCSRHMTGRKHMFQSLELKSGGYVGFRGNQKGKIIGSRTICNSIEDTTSEEYQSNTEDDVTNITETSEDTIQKIQLRRSEKLICFFSLLHLNLLFSRVVPTF